MARIDIIGFIDARRFSAIQIRVVILCALVALMDGFDTQAIGYVAPAIAKSWSLGKGALGPAFSAGLFGAMLGALIFGPVADRIGRKPVLVVCCAIFGVFGVWSSAADSAGALLVLRLLTGLGLGGAMPNAMALTSEYSPRRMRASMAIIAYCGFSIGAALGGVVASQLIGRFGWQSVFLVGGVIPLVIALGLVLWLPESVCFLALSPRRRGRLARILGEMDASTRFAEDTEFVAGGYVSSKSPVRGLFSDGRAKLTLLIWVIVFMNLLELYFITTWLPTVLNESGMKIGDAALVTALFQVGGTVGALALGRFIDRLRPFGALAIAYFGAAGFLALIGVLLGASATALALPVFFAGFCIVGGQIGIVAMTAASYPTAIRASGVGWALGIGRIGSIVGPLIGGGMLAMGWDNLHIFLCGAIPALIAAAGTIVIDRKSLHVPVGATAGWKKVKPVSSRFI